MAKSRRKSGGCTRGRLKPKKMGKGWLTMRKKRGAEKPVVRTSTENKGTENKGTENKSAENKSSDQ